MSFLYKKSQAANQSAVSGLSLQSSSYGKVVPLLYGTNRVAPNLIWYGDFVSIAQQSDPSSGGGKGGVGGGGGGKGGGGSTSYMYFTAVAFALCEGPIQAYGNAYVDKNITSTGALGLTEFYGTYPQSPWGYLTTNHPGQDLGYNGIAYVAASSYSLGNSAQLPNNNFEVLGQFSNSIAAQEDADPSLVIADILSNTHYGVGFPSAYVGTYTTYQAYTIANGLWISPLYDTATQAASILADLMVATNSEFVWSSGKLNIVPYGDQTITANGYTYTAPSTVQYALTDDDFVDTGADAGPVQCDRKRQADAYNSIQVECLDRTNQYNTTILEAKDQASIDLYGLRQNQVTCHQFCDPNAGRLSAQLMLGRQYVRNIYSFTLDARYVLLDPMDLVSITDATLGLNNQWVRIIDIAENADGSFAMTAEEYLGGTASAPAYAFQPASGFIVDYNSDPGNVNTPVIFDAPVQITNSGSYETWIAVSGGANWGGCDVYVSSDNTTYRLAGRVSGPSRQGVLTATFASGTDPDTTHTCSVDLSESFGTLLSGTTADADAFHTLCYVDGELIAYETATLTSAYNYNLGTYIRRGLYNTPISSHSSGSKFARLDSGIFTYPYSEAQVGQTFYIKFVSFNIYGGGQQSLAGVSPFTHVVSAIPTFVTEYSTPGTFTWTLPTNLNAQALVQVQVWGSGGSGAAGALTSSGNSVYAGGGGGGSYSSSTFLASALPSSVTVTVAAGGVGVKNSGTSSGGHGTAGNPGATSSFGALVIGYGGGAAPLMTNPGAIVTSSLYGGSGGAGGLHNNAGVAPPGIGILIGQFYNDMLTLEGWGIGDGSLQNITGTSIPHSGNFIGGGGGGLYGYTGTGVVASAGANSIYGGGGGGGAGDASSSGTTGGQSLYGGNGGAGSKTSNGTDGAQPGGGGGGTGGNSNSTTSGKGGDGRVIVLIYNATS